MTSTRKTSPFLATLFTSPISFFLSGSRSRSAQLKPHRQQHFHRNILFGIRLASIPPFCSFLSIPLDITSFARLSAMSRAKTTARAKATSPVKTTSQAKTTSRVEKVAPVKKATPQKASTRTTRGCAQKAAQAAAIAQREKSWEARETRWAAAEEKNDNLLRKPTVATSVYLDKGNRPKFDDRYLFQLERVRPGSKHPKLLHATKTGIWTSALQKYFEEMEPTINIPLAGVSKEPAFADRESGADDSVGSLGDKVEVSDRATAATSRTHGACKGRSKWDCWGLWSFGTSRHLTSQQTNSATSYHPNFTGALSRPKWAAGSVSEAG